MGFFCENDIAFTTFRLSYKLKYLNKMKDLCLECFDLGYPELRNNGTNDGPNLTNLNNEV